MKWIIKNPNSTYPYLKTMGKWVSEDVWTKKIQDALLFNNRDEARAHRCLDGGEKVVAYEREIEPQNPVKKASLNGPSLVLKPSDSYDTTDINFGSHLGRVKVFGTSENEENVSGRPLAQAICDFLNSKAFRKLNID